MDFMLIMSTERDGPVDPSVFPEMGKFAGELSAQGKLKGGQPLHPEAQGARIRLSGTQPVVTDGPFTETKEIIGGYFIIECESREEAIEIAKRCPHTRVGFVEVRELIHMGPPPE